MATHSSPGKLSEHPRRTPGRANALSAYSASQQDLQAEQAPANAAKTRQPAITLLTMSLLHRYYLSRRSSRED